jgi:Uma2 family endonuclease
MALKYSLPSVMTLDQFLNWPGDGSGRKYELIDGMPRAMAPASATHALLQANLAVATTTRLRGRNSTCRTGTEMPVVPPMKSRKNARIPDLTIVCGPPSDSLVAENPVVIVEILSPSNEDDTWESIRALAPIVSIREIVIVQSTEVGVEVYRRQADGNWPSEPETIGPGGTIRLDAVDIAFPIWEVYQGTHLAEAAAAAAG